ncbi:hypothetical protein R1flu_028948 [Riccia fluitans]|uniref:Uncharacterized protein n=1 Tax=Riccia fluitans TaxID=41844 RepID=A0ABD1XNP4_9MARC
MRNCDERLLSRSCFPVISCYSQFLGQKLNASIGHRKEKRGFLLAVASSSGRGVESEDEGDQVGQDMEVSEVIDVPNEAETRDLKLEAEIQRKEEYRKFRESLEVQRKRFWHNFKEQHQVYKVDREEWGVGLNPIFTVYEDAEGKRYKVDVHEEEIWMRSGVDPEFPQFAEDEARELVERRIAKANALARNIVDGVYEPNELSVLYKFQREGLGSRVGTVKEFSPPNFLPAPLRDLNVGNVFALTMVVGFAYKWWSGRKAKSAKPEVDDEEQRLMKMRKLRAKMNEKQVIQNPEVLQDEDTTEQGGDGVRKREPPETEATNVVVDVTPNKETGIKPSMQDEKFQRKVEEIRAMARQVRLQEEMAADTQSAQKLEKLEKKRSVEEETKKKIRSKDLESLAENLEDVRRLGFADEESTATVNLDFKPTSGPDRGNAGKSVNGKLPTVQKLRTPEDPTSSVADKPLSPESTRPANGRASPQGQSPSGVKPTLQEFSTPEDKTSSGADKQVLPESTQPANGRASPPGQSPSGVKPRIILSPKEARASIAAKRARLESADSVDAPRKNGLSVEDLKAKIKSKRAKAASDSISRTPKGASNGVAKDTPDQSAESLTSEMPSRPSLDENSAQGFADGQVSRLNLEDVPTVPSGEQDVGAPPVALNSSVPEDTKPPVTQGKEEERKPVEKGEKVPKRSKEEEEEQEWMSDVVLRDIVFKVQANEEAGREPFFGLNSEQEKRFFKGLERKFEREGERVKTWIKDRVENIDYGADGVSFNDPPEAYTMKWKEGMKDSSRASELSQKFSADRARIMQKQSGIEYTASRQVDDDEDDVEASKSRANPSKLTPEVSPKPEQTNIGQGKTKEIISGSGKTVVTSSGRPVDFTPGVPNTGKNEEDPPDSWQHTKRWAKDLQRKYEVEKDPQTRALMRDIGQDLDRWITEEEIDEASRLLDKGLEGEQEYVRMHYERTKAKIKQQRETFGREAMMSKYGEYKPEQEELELWWFELPYVLCLGLQSTVDGEVQSGLYSVDIGPAIEGVGDTSDAIHTVAFQDRGDAYNFCRLLQQESSKIGADGVEVIPFAPKELYRDAKEEGYKVTVIKKGQLQLSVDQSLEEVESRILEIGSARYYDDMIRDRSIDMDAVIDEGLGFGQQPQF